MDKAIQECKEKEKHDRWQQEKEDRDKIREMENNKDLLRLKSQH